MVTPASMVFAYHSTMALRAERRISLVDNSTSEQSVLLCYHFFTSALVGGPVEELNVFESTTSLAKSGVFPLHAIVHDFWGTFDSFQFHKSGNPIATTSTWLIMRAVR